MIMTIDLVETSDRSRRSEKNPDRGNGFFLRLNILGFAYLAQPIPILAVAHHILFLSSRDLPSPSHTWKILTTWAMRMQQARIRRRQVVSARMNRPTKRTNEAKTVTDISGVSLAASKTRERRTGIGLRVFAAQLYSKFAY